jgi:hypothetical protein
MEGHYHPSLNTSTGSVDAVVCVVLHVLCVLIRTEPFPPRNDMAPVDARTAEGCDAMMTSPFTPMTSGLTAFKAFSSSS